MTVFNQPPLTADQKIPRDRWGRPLLMVDGKRVPFTRASTVANAIEDTYNLTLWKQRQTAKGLTKRRDLYQLIASTDDKDALNDAVAQAMEAAGSSVAATMGTALHSFTETLDRGGTLEVELEKETSDLLLAYQHATRQMEWLGVEEFVAIKDLRVAGTFDRLCRFRDRLYIADIKTGTDAWKYAHAASVQFACYAHGSRYDVETQTWGSSLESEGVDQELGIMIHVDQFRREVKLYWVDIKTGWHMAQIAMEVRQWQKQSVTYPVEQ